MENREIRLEKELTDKLDTGASNARKLLRTAKSIDPATCEIVTKYLYDDGTIEERRKSKYSGLAASKGDFAGDGIQWETAEEISPQVLTLLDAIETDRGYIPHTDAGKQGIIDQDRIYAYNRPAVPSPTVEDDFYQPGEIPPEYQKKPYPVAIFLLGVAIGVCLTVLWVSTQLPAVSTLLGWRDK